jgi:hypothetical protein
MSFGWDRRPARPRNSEIRYDRTREWTAIACFLARTQILILSILQSVWQVFSQENRPDFTRSQNTWLIIAASTRTNLFWPWGEGCLEQRERLFFKYDKPISIER